MMTQVRLLGVYGIPETTYFYILLDEESLALLMVYDHELNTPSALLEFNGIPFDLNLFKSTSFNTSIAMFVPSPG